MLFSLLKHYLDIDTALKVSQSVYCFTTSVSHGVENYFPRLWGTGISDAIFYESDGRYMDKRSKCDMKEEINFHKIPKNKKTEKGVANCY